MSENKFIATFEAESQKVLQTQLFHLDATCQTHVEWLDEIVPAVRTLFQRTNNSAQSQQQNQVFLPKTPSQTRRRRLVHQDEIQEQSDDDDVSFKDAEARRSQPFQSPSPKFRSETKGVEADETHQQARHSSSSNGSKHASRNTSKHASRNPSKQASRNPSRAASRNPSRPTSKQETRRTRNAETAVTTPVEVEEPAFSFSSPEPSIEDISPEQREEEPMQKKETPPVNSSRSMATPSKFVKNGQFTPINAKRFAAPINKSYDYNLQSGNVRDKIAKLQCVSSTAAGSTDCSVEEISNGLEDQHCSDESVEDPVTPSPKKAKLETENVAIDNMQTIVDFSQSPPPLSERLDENAADMEKTQLNVPPVKPKTKVTNLIKSKTFINTTKAPPPKAPKPQVKALQKAEELRKIELEKLREREEKARTFKERQKQARDLLEQKRKEAALAKKQKEKERAQRLEEERKLKEDEEQKKRAEQLKQKELEQQQREIEKKLEEEQKREFLQQKEEAERQQKEAEAERKKNEQAKAKLKLMQAIDTAISTSTNGRKPLSVYNEDESMRLHRQEVLKKQAATAAAQAVMAASPQDYLPIMSRPEDNYDIGSLKSEDSTDDEDEPRKHIPLWAQKPALKAALYKQHVSDLSPSNIFPVVEAPVLSDIFPNTSKPRYKTRTSSALWQDSPSRPGLLKKMF